MSRVSMAPNSAQVDYSNAEINGKRNQLGMCIHSFFRKKIAKEMEKKSFVRPVKTKNVTVQVTAGATDMVVAIQLNSNHFCMNKQRFCLHFSLSLHSSKDT